MTTAKGITVLLNVEDVARSAAFYRDVFGLEITVRWEDQGRLRWARLKGGGVDMMLNESENGSPSAQRRARPEHTEVVLYVSVADADALQRELLAKGYQPGAVEAQSYGVRQFPLRDPDGYELAVTSPIAK